jgi:hypothetical protein
MGMGLVTLSFMARRRNRALTAGLKSALVKPTANVSFEI